MAIIEVNQMESKNATGGERQAEQLGWGFKKAKRDG